MSPTKRTMTWRPRTTETFWCVLGVVAAILLTWLAIDASSITTASPAAAKALAPPSPAPEHTTLAATQRSPSPVAVEGAAQRSAAAQDVVRAPVTTSDTPTPSDGWLTIPRLDFDVAGQFANACLGTTWQRLCRNTTLNPQDLELTAEQLRSLEALVAHHLAFVKAAIHRRGREQMETLQDLHAKGQLIELTFDMVPAAEREQFLTSARLRYRSAHAQLGLARQAAEEADAEAIRTELRRRGNDFVPDAAELLINDKGAFVSTRDQMNACAGSRRAVIDAQREFLLATLAWFVEQRFAEPHQLAHLPGAYDAIVATYLY